MSVLTRDDFKKAQGYLGSMETVILLEKQLLNANGGYANATIVDFDDNYVNVKIVYGKSLDNGDISQNEVFYKLDRKTWSIEEGK